MGSLRCLSLFDQCAAAARAATSASRRGRVVEGARGAVERVLEGAGVSTSQWVSLTGTLGITALSFVCIMLDPNHPLDPNRHPDTL